ncbi:protein adenylyltransferase SelO [Azonexus hydrophilus]|uniref:protein adenylyltransferase SelO n=1 Tax=Azonexus hydrophilus TaxID=418702 RepID=UPI001964EA50|nr:YdiU family protein [Azonexus hydrophilus]
MPEFRPFALSATYAQTLAEFCVPWQPAAAPAPKPVRLNRELAEELGADPDLLAGPEGLAMFAGNLLPAGAKPVAQAYAGHQFGGFSPRLGDGRALLLGEVIDRQGRRRDIAFKGSGRTPFSRNGDGKCALGPALREFLVGEAMHALGIPTTQALAVVATGDMVRRDRALPGAVLTRIAASHLRVGTFEYVAVHHGPAAVHKLADYAIARHDPDLVGRADRYLALLDAVAGRQAELVARWLGVGFIHGVMNTDNMTISGETIDYGPCAFLESYHPRTVYSSIDSQGRYAYGRQASIAQWNLARLAETLLPLIDTDTDRAIAAATAVIEAFPERHAACWLNVMRAKLGIDDSGDTETDRALADDFLSLLQRGRHDFTNSFRALHDFADGRPQALARLFADDPDAAAWQQRWQARQPQRDAALLATMKRANPWLIARNHQVENALEAAVDRNDLAPFEALLAALRAPFDERDTDRHYTEPAAPEITASYQTFCGT